jgi:hypothetical protein
VFAFEVRAQHVQGQRVDARIEVRRVSDEAAQVRRDGLGQQRILAARGFAQRARCGRRRAGWAEAFNPGFLFDAAGQRQALGIARMAVQQRLRRFARLFELVQPA